MASFDSLSGLAGEIRASTVSEQYDLAGYTEQRVKDLIVSAFGAPLTAPTEMIRFTFIVGGGKLVRSRYSDDLTKWMNSALREIGFSEDRSAAETFDSQGTFKQQHDTGQNLKYCIVYPRVACAATTASSSSSGASEGASSGASASSDSKQPESIVVAADLVLLQEIVNKKVSTWRQKKRLLKVLVAGKDRFKEVEAKLISGALLTPAEQSIYDANSGADDDKIAWVQSEIKKHVDTGKMDAAEKQEVLEQINSNLKACTDEISAASAATPSQPKKIEKLNEKKTTLQERKAAVERIVPVVHRLRHSDEIQKLRVKLLALLAVEDKGRSMSLTLADLKLLEGKSGIEEQIAGYETASREWFLQEDEFNAMCDADSRDAKATFAAKSRSAAAKKPSSTSSSSSSTGGKKPYVPVPMSSSAWSTAGGKGGARATASTGSGKKAGGTSFAAAFGGDSDSDD